MSEVWVVAAQRSPISPRNGALHELQAWLLASSLITDIVQKTGFDPASIQQLVLGNALYGGGNPARLAALHAGLPESMPAFSLDSQCCSGLDAIAIAAHMIRSGAAQAVIAGGAESWSRSPIRQHRHLDEAPEVYQRPAFSPWPERDPDMLDAAAALAAQRTMSRHAQELFAIDSHKKAVARRSSDAITDINGIRSDTYPRVLRDVLCARLPAIAGEKECALTAATTAVQADGAALLLLLSDSAKARWEGAEDRCCIRLLGQASGGADPAQPALAPIGVAQQLLVQHHTEALALYSTHLMEAFAVQAMVFIEALGLDAARCNPHGGALSRGHPIGASGAVEAVECFHYLQSAPSGARSLCAIAAAGGLGSALLLEKA